MEQGKKGRTPKPRLPITPSILRRVKAVWFSQGNTYEQVMLWAVAVTTFFSFCRLGEIVMEREDGYDPCSHLSYRDVATDSPKRPTIISLLLRRTKTDPIRQGVKVVIGRTGDDLCPVAALLQYLSLRGSRQGPLFIRADGNPLTKAKFVSAVRSAMMEAKLPASDYTGHSFRIGAATTAAAAGLDDSIIQTLGRWKSSAYLLYVKIDPQRLASVSNTLSNCNI